MALPVGWIASLSVGGDAAPTLACYRRVFTDPALQKALWNTCVLAFWVGWLPSSWAPLAWLTARTDVPGRGLIHGLVLIVTIYTFPYVYTMIANNLR